MARRRYISTLISVDPKVTRLAENHSDFAALLYTWMIPHAEDDTTLTGDPDELILTVIPGLRSKTREDVVSALEAMVEEELIIWDKENSVIYFPSASFYKYQTYIRQDKRMGEEEQPSPTNSEERRQTPKKITEQRTSPEKGASPSPSPSPSPSKDMCSVNDFFEEVWNLYPKKRGKGQVSATQKRKLHKLGLETLSKCIERYKQEMQGKDIQFMQNGSTFFNSGYVDYLDENYAEAERDPPPATEQEIVGWDLDNLPPNVKRIMELNRNAAKATSRH